MSHKSETAERTGPLTRAALILIAATSAIIGQYSLVTVFDPVRATFGWAIAALAFLSLYWLDPPGRELPSANERVPHTVEWPLAALVLAVGVFYRTFRLSELPSGLNHDVAWNGLYAVQILQGTPYTPYVSAAWGRETLMFYLQALAIKWFGLDLFALVLPAVAAMIVMLPLFYLWARSMFGARTALVATLLLGAAGWPLVFGRVGWRAVLQPLFITVTCFYFWQGIRTARARDFLAAGAGLALAVNTYNAARTFPLVFPLFAVARLVQRQRLQFIRNYWFGFLMMMLSFAVCAAPLAHYAINNWVEFQGRADALWAGPSQIASNLKSAALLFNYWGNGDDFFIETPLLELPVAILFVFGILWCLLRLRDERALFLVLGFLISILPGIVSRPNGNRCIGAMPFVYGFAGLGLLYFVRQAARLGRAGGALGLLLILFIGAAQARATFNEYLSHDRRRIWGFYPETTVLGRYMRTLVGRYAIWVGGANFPRDTLTFFSYPGEGDPFQRHYTWLDDVTYLVRRVPQPPPGRGLAIILSTIDAAPVVMEQMQRRFPVHEMVELRWPEETGRVFARALLVQSNELPQQLDKLRLEPPTGSPLWSGGRGFQLAKFNTPKGLARSPDGYFYVADTGNHRVQKFDSEGRFVAAWGQVGSIPGSFNEPTDLAVDGDGNVHVVDTWNNRVQKLSPSGKVLAVYGPPAGFYGPRGIAVTEKLAYVTDGGNNMVFVFDLNGSYVSQFGKPGHEPGELFQPVGVAVDRDGLIWVVDSGSNRLQAFREDGTLAKMVPVPGWQGDHLKEGYLVLTDMGLILSDPFENRLLRLKGDQLVDFATDVRLSGPSGLASDHGTLYVSERGRNAVGQVPLVRK